MPVGAQLKVPAAPRLRRLLPADLFGRVAVWPAVVLVALLVIDSHVGDGYG
jgi:hypothetical protein